MHGRPVVLGLRGELVETTKEQKVSSLMKVVRHVLSNKIKQIKNKRPNLVE